MRHLLYSTYRLYHYVNNNDIADSNTICAIFTKNTNFTQNNSVLLNFSAYGVNCRPNGVATMTTVFKQSKITHRIRNEVLGRLRHTYGFTETWRLQNMPMNV